jgi:hypothetical protein
MLSAVLLLLTGAARCLQVRLPLIVLFTKLASPLSSPFPRVVNAVGASNGLAPDDQKPLPLA